MRATPYRKGLEAGRAYRAAREAFFARPLIERRGELSPPPPANPYPEPVGKRGRDYANSGYRQWADGFRYGVNAR